MGILEAIYAMGQPLSDWMYKHAALMEELIEACQQSPLNENHITMTLSRLESNFGYIVRGIRRHLEENKWQQEQEVTKDRTIEIQAKIDALIKQFGA